MAPVAFLFLLTTLFAFLQGTRPHIGGHHAVFLGFNLVFISIVMTVPAMAYLAGFMLFTYALSLAACKWHSCHPLVFLAPAILVFCIVKRYDILPLQQFYTHIPEIVGVSYIIFRTVNVILDSRSTETRPRLLPYLNYCLSLFTLLSGPIQRYRAFNEDMERRKEFRADEQLAAASLTRFMNGVLKTIFLAPIMQGVQAYCMTVQWPTIGPITGNVLQATDAVANPTGFGLAALSYLVFLYLNFSGYTDMVIGLGNLVGFRLPENFDRPFTATNFLDFWKHWHMSLSFWFRDYCFTPIVKRVVKAGVKTPAIATLPAFFISFALLGIWHGRTWPFIFCGLSLAVGATLNHCYKWALTGIRAAGRNRLANSRLYAAFTSALTYLYISIAIAGLWLSGPELAGLWRSFSLLQAGLSFGLITAWLGVLLYCVRSLLQMNTFEQAVVGSIREFFEGESSFLIAFKMFMFLVWFFSLSTNLPDLVYQEF